MRRNMVVAVVIFLLALLASSVAWAHGSRHGHPDHGFSHHGHHGHFHSRAQVDVIIGAPLVLGSWQYRAPYYGYYGYPYSYPPVVVAPASPATYIERGQEPDAIQQSGVYWNYCSSSQAYYPYVKECPTGWQLVPAQPPYRP